MVKPVDSRIAKLTELFNNPESKVGTSRLFYKGEPRNFDVHEIDLDYLVFNRHNGRFESEMQTWQREQDIGEREYTPEIHEKIKDILWNSNRSRNKHTLQDLKVKHQLRPGIVSLDGVVIDGNRRFMLLHEISPRRPFQAVILPDEYYKNEKEIVRLETEFQIGEDSKLDYGPLEKYLKVKRLREWFEPDEIAAMMAIKESKIAEYEEIMRYMDDFLEYIECAGLYKLLNNVDGSSKEGMFVDLYRDINRIDAGATIPWEVKKRDKASLLATHFDFIRLGSGVLAGKDYREISFNSRGKETFFANEPIWRKFRERVEAAVEPGNEKVGSLDEFFEASDYPVRSEAAEAREAAWRNAVKGPLEGAFNQAHNELEAEVDRNEPRKLLQRAMAQLERIDYERDAFLEDEQNEDLIKQIHSLSYQMKRRFDRAGVRY